MRQTCPSTRSRGRGTPFPHERCVLGAREEDPQRAALRAVTCRRLPLGVVTRDRAVGPPTGSPGCEERTFVTVSYLGSHQTMRDTVTSLVPVSLTG